MVGIDEFKWAMKNICRLVLYKYFLFHLEDVIIYNRNFEEHINH